MSSYYDDWYRAAAFCANTRLSIHRACDVQEHFLNQAQVYFTWLTTRKRGWRLESADPTAEVLGLRGKKTWFYADALEAQLGEIPHVTFYEWCQAALARMTAFSEVEIYGESGFNDFKPWGWFSAFTIQGLHDLAHLVGRQSHGRYSDNPWRIRHIPNRPQPEVKEWVKAQVPDLYRHLWGGVAL